MRDIRFIPHSKTFIKLNEGEKITSFCFEVLFFFSFSNLLAFTKSERRVPELFDNFSSNQLICNLNLIT